MLVFSFASVTSGTPRNWAATQVASGVNLLCDLSETSVAPVSNQIAHFRQPHEKIVVSLHWGPNGATKFPTNNDAHSLIEQADISIIHGHSSRHANAIEVYRNRLILYGCGDFLNDYEGIAGYEEYRDDLGLMYFADIETERGTLAALEIVPLQIRKFQLVRPTQEDTQWVQQTLDEHSSKFATRIEFSADVRPLLS